MLNDFAEAGRYESDFLVREKQLKELIEIEVAALPEQMRKAFEISRNHDLAHKEIAEQLGVSEGVVRNNISRSLKILREKLGPVVLLYLLLKR
ncbi:RNA polymerase sigma factor, sigma-70 family [Pedobacter soli]|uniref:RNA polymerase sigma factor, sigma-70 family n=1 Tax=Pedobacter soli TaxID=390242 RepID=A0A1G6JZ19_9SPHI|nr:sigma factor-like helix-turn-helix DNA-binding protein [Pedobacter kyungheensis]SDC23964.1 RNA polymerase sigma factor, sigma-70 family [Pedobacter soli]